MPILRSMTRHSYHRKSKQKLIQNRFTYTQQTDMSFIRTCTRLCAYRMVGRNKGIQVIYEGSPKVRHARVHTANQRSAIIKMSTRDANCHPVKYLAAPIHCF